MERLRCRLGLHHWARIRETDGEVANPAESARWTTRCRDCGRVRGTGQVGSIALFVLAFAAAVAIFLTFSPFLGAIVMVGAVLGLGWAMGPALIAFVVRWLSTGR